MVSGFDNSNFNQGSRFYNLSEKLKKRINRRLVRLARWSDSSVEERQSEFRRLYPSSNSVLGGGSSSGYKPNPGYVGYPTAGSYPLPGSRISAPGIPNIQKTPMQMVGAPPPSYTGQSGMRMAPPSAGVSYRNPALPAYVPAVGPSTYQPAPNFPGYQPRPAYVPSANSSAAVAAHQVVLPPLNPATSLAHGMTKVQLQPTGGQSVSNQPSQEQKNETS